MLHEGFTYTDCKTLTGYRLIAGIKEKNSYILIKNKYRTAFFTLMDKISKREGNISELSLSIDEHEILDVLKAKGYYDNHSKLNESFNEFNRFVNVFFSIPTVNFDWLTWKNQNSLYFTYITIWILSIIYIINNISLVTQTLSPSDFTILEIMFCIVIMSNVVSLTHEFGHYILSQFLGVKASRVTYGLFIAWPVIYVEYFGLNLYSTAKKITVISAGIFIHLANVVLGIFISNNITDHKLINVWIVCNMGMFFNNMWLIGPTDGYFFISNALGIYNLRLKGYRAISSIIKRHKYSLDKVSILSAIGVIFTWIISILSIRISISYYSLILGINQTYTMYAIRIAIILLLIRFLHKIYKIDI